MINPVLTWTWILPSLNDLKWPIMPSSVGVKTKPSFDAVTEYCSSLSSGPTLWWAQYNNHFPRKSRLAGCHLWFSASSHSHPELQLTIWRCKESLFSIPVTLTQHLCCVRVSANLIEQISRRFPGDSRRDFKKNPGHVCLASASYVM